MFALALLCVVISVAESTSPERCSHNDFKKVGCFRKDESLFHDIMITDLDPTHHKWGQDIDWGDFQKSLHSLACRCEAKVRGKYDYFAIGFYGECWGGSNSEKIRGRMYSSSDQCIGGDYEKCDKGSKHECAGTEDDEYVYQIVESRTTTKWIEVYSQTKASPIFKNQCTLESCDVGSGKDFINFDVIKKLPQYHFKIVWNEGKLTGQTENKDYALEWTQKENPLSKKDSNMKPTAAQLIPSNEAPYKFNGLSLSSSPSTLLDGIAPHRWWWYSIGNIRDHTSKGKSGNPANLWKNDYGKGLVASRTQLFVEVPAGTPIDEAYKTGATVIKVDRSSSPHKVTVIWSNGRPNAHGQIDESNNVQPGFVIFPDDRKYNMWYHADTAIIYWEKDNGGHVWNWGTKRVVG